MAGECTLLGRREPECEGGYRGQPRRLLYRYPPPPPFLTLARVCFAKGSNAPEKEEGAEVAEVMKKSYPV